MISSLSNAVQPKSAAIIQSSYIPWKGYFDLINFVDDFVLYDDVQYTRRDWRNRNKIKTPQGLVWLTVPVEVKGKYLQKIKETKIAELSWAENHFQTLTHAYKKAPYWGLTEPWLQRLYERAAQLTMLSEVNFLFLQEISKRLEINTKFHWSSDFLLAEGKSERLLEICKQLGAAEYVSGPAAKDYLDSSIFQRTGVSVSWADYSGYAEYDQLYPPFSHGVTVIDLLVHTGPEARSHLKSASARSIVEIRQEG